MPIFETSRSHEQDMFPLCSSPRYVRVENFEVNEVLTLWRCHHNVVLSNIIENLVGGKIDLKSMRSKNIEHIELDNGEIVSAPKEIAERLNSYLITVQSCGPTLTTFFISPTDVNEVLATIKNLKNKKSSGFDNITVEVIKKSAEVISPVIVHIVNLSFQNGCKHVEKIESDYAAAEPQIDNIIESHIISVGSDTDSSDSDPEEEDNLSGIEELQ
ncbi:hypothetical protein J6590_082311 [Homalodisca vitripennis]|nr:hypothetical protein J6590_082311 [Homalodisca vitripennis]